VVFGQSDEQVCVVSNAELEISDLILHSVFFRQLAGRPAQAASHLPFDLEAAPECFVVRTSIAINISIS